MPMPGGCENPKCGCSTSTFDFLTFGSGKLDSSGFWEKPCGPCARAAEQLKPKDAPCWPFTDEQLKELDLEDEKL